MLELESFMAEEAGGEFGVTADAAEAAVKRAAKATKLGRAHVGQFARLDIAPHLFDGIQFGRVRGQAFNGEPGPLPREICFHPPALVGAEAVPDQQDSLATKVTLERSEERDQTRVGVRPGQRLKEEADIAPVPAERQCAGDGEPLPMPAGMPQDRRLAARCPRPADDGLLRDAAFVLEDEPGAAALGVFFSCAQRVVFHSAIAASSRSRARRAGRWSDHPSFRNTRHTCPGWCSTPVTRWMATATRGKVHKSVGNPCAAGPATSARSTFTSSSAPRRGLRPARPAAFRPGRPSAAHAWCQ
jgi:hypothetical protein